MSQNNRINIIDEVRGALIILVVIYHLFYDLAVMYRVEAVQSAFKVMRFLQPSLPFMFILISGISFQLSRNNLKRGLILGAISLAITLALWIATPDYIILFGILHLLAFANTGNIPAAARHMTKSSTAVFLTCFMISSYRQPQRPRRSVYPRIE